MTYKGRNKNKEVNIVFINKSAPPKMERVQQAASVLKVNFQDFDCSSLRYASNFSNSSLEGEVSACAPCLMYVWPSMVMVSLLMNSLLDLVNFRRFECVNQIQGRSLSKGRSSRSQRYKVGSGWALGCLV